VTVAPEATRRHLTPRQVAVVDRLVDAAAEEAREQGYDSMSVRSAAKRAGVAPATAYTYFASKDHLLAEVMWRRMEALPLAAEVEPDPLARVTAELRVLGLFMADDPMLAAACTTALLGSGSEVRALRLRFGVAVHNRLRSALGEERQAVLQGLDLAYSGAMLWGGLGHLPLADIPDTLADVARQLLVGAP